MVALPSPSAPAPSTTTDAVSALLAAPHWVAVVQMGPEDLRMFVQVPEDDAEALRFVDAVEKTLAAMLAEARKVIGEE